MAANNDFFQYLIVNYQILFNNILMVFFSLSYRRHNNKIKRSRLYPLSNTLRIMCADRGYKTLGL